MTLKVKGERRREKGEIYSLSLLLYPSGARRRAYIVGLGGQAGSGKTSIARYLARRGAEVIDTDRIGWQLLRADTPVYRRVVRAFGPEILTGSGAIDRRALGRIVFRRKTELAKLNRIVHPALLAELRRRINAPDGITTKTPRHQEPRTVIRGPTDDGKRTTDDGQGARGRPILVVDAALLFFWGWQKHVDLAVLVAAPRNVKLRRLTKTGLTRAEARRRLKSQMPEARMRKLAHLVIENQGTRQELFAQCRKLWQLLRSGSSGRIDRR